MKNLLIIALAITCCYACKKDKGGGRHLLLSKMYEDGLLKLEYFYSADKRPQRRNMYGTGTGQSVFAGFRLYQYQNELPVEASDFNSNNQFTNRYTVTYDLNKRPSRVDYYNSSNTLYTYYTLDYNASGQMTTYSAFNANTSKKTLEAQFKWDQQGQVAGINRYTFTGNTLVKYDSTTYKMDNKQFPAWWSYYEMIPIIALPKGDNTFYDMICTSSFYYYVDAPPSTTDFSMSDRTYNNDGLVIKQRTSYTTKSITNYSNTVERTYEYTE